MPLSILLAYAKVSLRERSDYAKRNPWTKIAPAILSAAEASGSLVRFSKVVDFFRARVYL